jgi:predicted N-formylglutamate amidohydrolase
MKAFRGCHELLKSHRGYDPGSKELAVTLSRGLKTPLYSSDISRLLVDLNRSPGHPHIFSEISRAFARHEKTVILESYYLPYRRAVESVVERLVPAGEAVLHLSVHTFTPILGGSIRRADIGLLYDPGRKTEASFSLSLQKIYSGLLPGFKIRRNYPYPGRSDSLTFALRKRFVPESYLGIELELNQKYPTGDPVFWRRLKKIILKGLRLAIEEHCSVVRP